MLAAGRQAPGLDARPPFDLVCCIVIEYLERSGIYVRVGCPDGEQPYGQDRPEHGGEGKAKKEDESMRGGRRRVLAWTGGLDTYWMSLISSLPSRVKQMARTRLMNSRHPGHWSRIIQDCDIDPSQKTLTGRMAQWPQLFDRSDTCSRLISPPPPVGVGVGVGVG